MFRNTFVTGQVLYGTNFRQVTAQIDDSVSPPTVQYITPRGAVIPVTKDMVWKTLRSVRNVAKHTLNADRRFSGDGPTMFSVPMKNLTNAKGKVKGRTENTPEFILHMLAVSGEDAWGTETRTDRENDAATLIAALHS